MSRKREKEKSRVDRPCQRQTHAAMFDIERYGDGRKVEQRIAKVKETSEYSDKETNNNVRRSVES